MPSGTRGKPMRYLRTTIFWATMLFAGATFAQTNGAPAPQRSRTVTGDLRIVSKFHSNFLNNDRDIAIWLPPNYENEPKRRYAVLYMHDGQNLFNLETSYLPDQEWRVDEIATSLIEGGLIEPAIVVGVNNGGMERGNEYLPTRVRDTGGKADLYGRMLVEELKPFIDRTYRTKTKASDTGLAGSSFGGVITMYLGIKYPNVFGKLAVLSPSVWWDDRELLKEVDKIPRKTNQRIWIDIGTREGSEATADRPVTDAIALRDHLVSKGWRQGKDLAFFKDFGAHHNEIAWAGRMDAILMFLFGR
ncbi:alpha/beta hydrolase [Fimbriimonas ginsengisoli]|uniref:Putative esterase n=1 Tax=Fimbriimonas ginsengisoli Gsoil 348 TaxID=661478 RepID=A0A068NU44_FIMGI|nr:alpha/beta hydrolase-fold protein [Fimbriimonas ginsengisoli]AIE85104.1 putative esterase [Fimbriimonas ginsengisoli Gsoil 348]